MTADRSGAPDGDDDEPEIILDLSRLLSRIAHATPTGIDRVELAYARELRTVADARLAFAAVHPAGLYGRLDRDAVLRFLDATEARWERGDAGPPPSPPAMLRALFALRPRRSPASATRRRVYLQASPDHLTRPALVRAILRRERARFACLVHDLIPLDYPEYARPKGPAQQAARVATIAALASGIITNSHATLATLLPRLERAGASPAIAIAHLGVDLHAAADAAAPDRPYFVVLSTIEPRKNHLLLLNIWRRLAETHGSADIPRLLLIGRRGWENEQVVDMLERCPALAGCVEEHAGLPDRAVRALLAGARALLMPSFAEGYGMPVTEALQAGVPVLCSDLPALREAGGDAPDYLDPIDGPSWTRAILDYAAPGSAARADQLRRIGAWRAPTWPAHIAIVLELLHRIAR